MWGSVPCGRWNVPTPPRTPHSPPPAARRSPHPAPPAPRRQPRRARASAGTRTTPATAPSPARKAAPPDRAAPARPADPGMLNATSSRYCTTLHQFHSAMKRGQRAPSPIDADQPMRQHGEAAPADAERQQVQREHMPRVRRHPGLGPGQQTQADEGRQADRHGPEAARGARHVVLDIAQPIGTAARQQQRRLHPGRRRTSRGSLAAQSRAAEGERQHARPQHKQPRWRG